MKTRLPSDKDFELWRLLLQARDSVFKARDKELRQYGITIVEAGALLFIKAIGDNPTPAKLSKWLFREHHTVSALLRRMEKKGLITKVKDVGRKNSWRISLTEKGQKAYRQSFKRESIHGVMSSLSESEHQQLESYLRKVRDQAVKYLYHGSIFPFP